MALGCDGALTALVQENEIGVGGVGALMMALEQNDSLVTLKLSVRLQQPLQRCGRGADTSGQYNPIIYTKYGGEMG
jgi:hypothetical protein